MHANQPWWTVFFPSNPPCQPITCRQPMTVGTTLHPASSNRTPSHQILVELADLQDQEVGDGTTSVVILAAELLRRANDLVGG